MTSKQPSAVDKLLGNGVRQIDIKVSINHDETEVQLYVNGQFRGHRRYWRDLDAAFESVAMDVRHIIQATRREASEQSDSNEKSG